MEVGWSRRVGGPNLNGRRSSPGAERRSGRTDHRQLCRRPGRTAPETAAAAGAGGGNRSRQQAHAPCQHESIRAFCMLRSASLLISAASLALQAPAAWAGPNMRDQLIQHYCEKAVNSEFAAESKTPPAGMAAFTCNCVVEQMDARASLEQAQAICKQQAIQKYNLLP